MDGPIQNRGITSANGEGPNCPNEVSEDKWFYLDKDDPKFIEGKTDITVKCSK